MRSRPGWRENVMRRATIAALVCVGTAVPTLAQQPAEKAADAEAKKRAAVRAKFETAKDGAPVLPVLDWRELKIGYWGQLPATMECVQVLDEHSALVQPEFLIDPGTTRRPPRYSHGQLVLLIGISTKGMVDGKEFKRAGAFRVKGTKTYPTAHGGTNTVPELSPAVEVEQILAEAKAEFAAKRAAAKHAAAEEAAKAEAAKRLAIANGKLRLAKRYRKIGKPELAEKLLTELVDDFADTPAAVEAEKLLADR